MGLETAAIAGIGAAASGVGNLVGGVGSAFAPGQPTGRLSMPPELEVSFLNQMTEAQRVLSENIQRNRNLTSSFNEKINVLDSLSRGDLPQADAVARLRSLNSQIAQSFGENASEAVKNGFLSEADLADLNELKSVQSQDFVDPRFEQDAQKQRSILEQELARRGASPSVRAQALAQFDNQLSVNRFQNTQNLRESQSNLIAQRLGVRSATAGQNQQQALNSFNALQQGINSNQQAGSNLLTIAGAQIQGNQQLQQASLSNIDASRQIFSTLGQTDFSGGTRKLLRQGNVGPGNVSGQTGLKGPTPAQQMQADRFDYIRNRNRNSKIRGEY